MDSDDPFGERAAGFTPIFPDKIVPRMRTATLDSISISVPERHHPGTVPKKEEPGYYEYLQKQRDAMLIAVTAKDIELAKAVEGRYVTIVENSKLTVEFKLHSQSKLSQQDLAELQKATKFDKKELQQWYKGKPCKRSSAILRSNALLRWSANMA
jgi:hypothetical protein